MFIDLYCSTNNSSSGLSIIGSKALSKDKVLRPETPGQLMLSYTIAAYVIRAFGDVAR